MPEKHPDPKDILIDYYIERRLEIVTQIAALLVADELYQEKLAELGHVEVAEINE